MSLAEILQQLPERQELLFRRVPYEDAFRHLLLRDVLALANIDFDGPRRILFGIDEAADRPRVIGLDPAAIDRVHGQLVGLPAMIEPGLRILPVVAEVGNRRVVAVEIDACANPPYVARERVADEMHTGACWIRDGAEIRPVRRVDLEKIYARRGESPPLAAEVLPAPCIGLGDDPECEVLTLQIPDNSNPPSKQARDRIRKALEAQKAARRFGDEDTGLARLAHARIFGADAPYVAQGVDTLVERYNHSVDEFRDADLYYRYEQQAVRLNLTVQVGPAGLENAVTELHLPRVAGFDIADRIYVEVPDARSDVENRLLGYPDVRKRKDRFVVRVGLGNLEPGTRRLLFDAPLRLAVSRPMQGRKLAIRYALAAANLEQPAVGRLKLVFTG